ncbi:hypothetical protein Tco_1447315 [Tanacetum coccineum]
MSSSNTSLRDYSRKHKREIIEPWRQCHNPPPSPPNRTSPPLSPSNSLPISPPNSPIFDTTSLLPSPNSSNPTSSSLPPQISTQNHSMNYLHKLLHLSNLLDINIQHVIASTNRSPPSSPFTHPPFLDQINFIRTFVIVAWVSSDIVQFIEPYDRPEAIITEPVASSDQNDQLVQNDEVLNGDQTKHSNHINDEHIIEKLINIKDIQVTEPPFSSTENASAPNKEILNHLRYMVEEVRNKVVEEVPPP